MQSSPNSCQAMQTAAQSSIPANRPCWPVPPQFPGAHLRFTVYAESYSPRITETRFSNSHRGTRVSGYVRMRLWWFCHFSASSRRLLQINRHRTRNNSDSGKSLVRSLLRKLPRRPWIFRSKHGVPPTRSCEHHEFPHRHTLALPPRHFNHECRLHPRHYPRLGAAASELGQRRNGRICDLASSNRS